MRKLLAILLSMLILTPCISLIGCDGNGEETTTPSVDSIEETTIEETEAPSMDGVIFDETGMIYRVVRGTYANTVEVNAAVDLNKAIRAMYNGEMDITIGDDFMKGQTKDDIFETDTYELLVGVTNRKESHDAKATLALDEYVIKLVGNKLVVIGYDCYATAGAVEYFIDNILSKSDGNTLVIDKDFEYRGESSLRKISIHKEAQYRIMSWNLGCMVSDEKNGEKECIDIILRYLPDIMGLQECNAAVYSKVLNSLPEFYKHAVRKHSGTSTDNYTPIIYNSELFDLLEAEVAWLRGRYTGTNTKSISYAVFQDKNGEKFALINFHGAVCSNSYKGFENYTSEELSAQAHAWKLDNVVQVIEIKNSIIAKYGNIPVMVSGDNNFNSNSQQYKNMQAEGFLDAEHTARIERMTGYKTSFSYGTEPGDGLSIDHIFGLNDIDFVVHQIVRGSEVYKASDHCPVYVDFQFKS